MKTIIEKTIDKLVIINHLSNVDDEYITLNKRDLIDEIEKLILLNSNIKCVLLPESTND